MKKLLAIMMAMALLLSGCAQKTVSDWPPTQVLSNINVVTNADGKEEKIDYPIQYDAAKKTIRVGKGNDYIDSYVYPKSINARFRSLFTTKIYHIKYWMEGETTTREYTETYTFDDQYHCLTVTRKHKDDVVYEETNTYEDGVFKSSQSIESSDDFNNEYIGTIKEVTTKDDQYIVIEKLYNGNDKENLFNEDNVDLTTETIYDNPDLVNPISVTSKSTYSESEMKYEYSNGLLTSIKETENYNYGDDQKYTYSQETVYEYDDDSQLIKKTVNQNPIEGDPTTLVYEYTWENGYLMKRVMNAKYYTVYTDAEDEIIENYSETVTYTYSDYADLGIVEEAEK